MRPAFLAGPLVLAGFAILVAGFAMALAGLTHSPAAAATATTRVTTSTTIGNASGGPTPTPAPVFPAVDGTSLSGKAFRLPADFDAPLNLVFVAYAREQQATAETWKPNSDALLKRYPALRIWELPVLSRGLSLVRGMIDGGMRRGIPDPHVRDTTITLYIDKAAFDRSLGIASEDTISVLLVRPNGEVVWHGSGPYSEAAAAELLAAIDPASR